MNPTLISAAILGFAVWILLRKDSTMLNPAGRPRKSVVNESEIAKMYELGHNSRQLSELYGITTATVLAIARKHRIKIRPGHRSQKLSQSDQKELVDLYKKGISPTEIQKRFNISPMTVLYIAKEHGLKIKRGRPWPKKNPCFKTSIGYAGKGTFNSKPFVANDLNDARDVVDRVLRKVPKSKLTRVKVERSNEC